MSDTFVLFAVSLVGLASNAFVLGLILMGGLAGWRQGFFRATLAGFFVLGAFIASIATAELVAELLVQLEIPGEHAVWMAYAGMLVAFGYGGWAWIEAYATEPIWECQTLFGRLVAVGIGCVAGGLASGCGLIGWTMIPVPRAIALQHESLVLDTGKYALELFGKCIERDRERREELLGGADGATGVVPRASEPFIDLNGNCVRDDAEPFLDRDGSGAFTPQVQVNGKTVDATAAWPVGLLDHYAMASWKPSVALHAPVITSPTDVVLEPDLVAGAILYQAAANDLDAGDTLRYSLETADGEQIGDLMIDETTGAITSINDPETHPEEGYCFELIVTDRAELSARAMVRLRFRKPKPTDAMTAD